MANEPAPHVKDHPGAPSISGRTVSLIGPRKHSQMALCRCCHVNAPLCVLLSMGSSVESCSEQDTCVTAVSTRMPLCSGGQCLLRAHELAPDYLATYDTTSFASHYLQTACKPRAGA